MADGDIPIGADPAYQQALLAYLMGAGGLPGFGALGIPTQPSFTPAQMNSITGAVPPELNPTQQANYLQDYVSLMMDPAVAAMFGGGAYSPDAFAPTAEYTPVATPGRDTLMRYAATPGSIESYFAQHILGGGTASTAVQELREAYEAEPEDEEVAQEVANLVGQLMLREDEFTGELNWQDALEKAQAFQELAMQDPMPGAIPEIRDPVTGEVISGGGEIIQTTDAAGNPVLMQVEYEDSPMAEWYRERGLSLPTDEYMPEDFLGEQWRRGVAEFGEAYGAYQQAQQRYLDDLDRQATQESIAAAAPSMARDAANLYAGGFAMGGSPFDEAPIGGDEDQQRQQQRPPSTVAATAPYGSDMIPPPQTVNESVERSGSYVEPNQSPGMQGQGVTDVAAVLGRMDLSAAAEYVERNAPSMSPSELARARAWAEEQAPLLPSGDPDLQYVNQIISTTSGSNQGMPASPLPRSESVDWYPTDYDDPNVMGPPTGPPTGPNPFLRQNFPGMGGGGAGHMRAQGRRMPEGDDEPNPIPLSERNQMAADSGTARRSRNDQLRFQQQAMLEQVLRFGGSGRDREPTDEERRRFRSTNPATARISGDAPSRARSGNFDFDAWDQMLAARDRSFGADYGRAAAAAYLLQQQGVTPLQQQLAARRQVPIGMGLVGSGYLPGVG